MSYFTEWYVKFFRALEKHNDKKWFDANKHKMILETKATKTDKRGI